MDAYNAAAWLVDRHVDQGRGERVALRCDGRDTTYTALQSELWRVQRALAHFGVTSGERVAMVVNDEPDFVAWFLGSLRQAVVPVPLSTMLTGTELGGIVADCGARTLVVSEPFAAAVAAITAAAPLVRDVVVLGRAAGASAAGDASVQAWASFTDQTELPVAPTGRDSDGFWLYSSGTTGTPKGVMHRHGDLEATAQSYAANILHVTEKDRFLSVAKLFFAYGLGNSLTFPLAVGGTAILHPRPPTAATMVALIEQEQPSLFFASPGFVAALLDAAPAAALFHSLRATVTAGESLPAPLQRRFSELTGTPVLDGIGSTEMLHIFISNTLTEQAPGSSGWAVPGYRAELRDDDQRIVTEPDTPGYLYVQGSSAASGYWQKPQAEAEAFSDGWVRTGDVYTRSAQDCWTFLGRNNDMIKAGGIWVSPAEVESVLIEHPDVLEAAVVGERNRAGLEMVVAFVVPATGASIDPAALVAHCRARIAAFKRPSEIVVVDELPKTATGKIKRYALREARAAAPERS